MQLNRSLDKIKNRKAETDDSISRAVAEILATVKTGGDRAVSDYAAKFDGFTDINWLVSEAEIVAANREVGADFRRILERAAIQITKYHANQIEKSWSIHGGNGTTLGQIVRPLRRVALYVPGGTAAYPSTLLMNAIPATLAGVPELIILTPVKSDGKVPAAILTAADICGVKTIYKIGGAHGVAAAGLGTETIAAADKIVGPGNIYVATAKRQLFGKVAIDMIAGPSDILIIADESANPKYIAADLMGQAEHDTLASSILVTTSEKLIAEVEAELVRQLPAMNRAAIIKEALTNYGAAILAADLEEAFDVANDIAPEHLEILTENPMEKLPLVQNAGSIFLGEHTPEVLGDYMSGTNHVLPTEGTARFSSPLGVYDFVKYSAFSHYPRAALAAFKDDVATFATAEGFDAHANSVMVRFEDETA